MSDTQAPQITLLSSDKIFVLKNKSISESGAHQELLNRAGDYYDLWKSQFFSPETINQ